MASRIDYTGLTPEQRIREYVRVALPIARRALRGRATATANVIGDAGCAAMGGRTQAAAAAPADSLRQPAVQ